MRQLVRIAAGTTLLVLAFCRMQGQAQTMCPQGLVYRDAFQGDRVCVTPEARRQAMEDNQAALSRRASPSSDQCARGFVWREANPQDHVCVLPATRSQVAEQNRMARLRMPNAAGDAGVIQIPGHALNHPQFPQGFHISPNPVIRMGPPSLIRLHPRPVPLGGSELDGALARLGFSGVHLVQPQVATVTGYQLEDWDSSIADEVNTTMVSSSILAGGNGYVAITFTAYPGVQYLLDCSLGMDGTYQLSTSYQGGNSPVLDGTVSSFNGHLLIPLTQAPAGTQSGQVVIHFGNGGIELDGCQLERVSQ